MQTELDAEIVGWVGRLGAAGAEHVQGRFNMRRSWCYARLSQLVAGGLVEQRTLLHRRPGLYLATRAGLRWRGLERLGAFQVRPGGFEHAWEVATVAVALDGRLPGWRLLSEREIRVREREDCELLASARVGALPGGRPALHRPDLALIDPAGQVLAVEVELSIKARARLEAICRGWARARHITRVYYLAAPPVMGALERAIRETRAQERVTVLALKDPAALAAAAQREAGHVDR
jgi:hypothetical protein